MVFFFLKNQKLLCLIINLVILLNQKQFNNSNNS